MIGKISRYISFGLLLLILLAILWYNVPPFAEDKFARLPGAALAYGQIKINWDEPGPQAVFEIMWKKMTALNPQLDNFVARAAARYLLPREMAVAVLYDRAGLVREKGPDTVLVMKYGKRTKLLKLAKAWLSFTGKGQGALDGFLIENDLVKISSLGWSYAQISPEQLIEIKNILKTDNKDVIDLYLPNKKGQVTSLVKAIEDKYNFAVFPSIEGVDHVRLSGNLEGSKALSGKLVLASGRIADVDRIGLDAIFLNSLLTRILLGAGYGYEGRMYSLANYVEINYQLSNLDNFWKHWQ
jgi:hypothetical protein